MSEQLGAYVLDKRIGAGGMADVFLARGPGGVCVIKRPHPHLCASADFVRMFLDEASLLAQLNHPSIARIFDLGQQNGVYYLAMEYVPGFDLMTISLEHERQGEYMAPELAAKVVADAAGALHYAHDAVGANGQPLHIIHRDVSPHNILVSTRGEVKLIDFGVARAAKTMHRTQAGLVKGKYPYMSPEQITGQTIDRRVDVYALGLVLYELLTNARAIAGDLEVQQIENARHGRIKPVEQLRPNVPATLRKILAGALHPQPEGRYQSAAALQKDLEAYIVADRHVVGREDLVRLFRVVAAEASHLPPEFDSAPAPAADPGNSAETMRSGAFIPPSTPGADSSETMRSGAFVSPSPQLPIPPDDDSHHPTDQVPLTEHGAELAATLLPPTALATPIPLVLPPPGAPMPAPIQLTAEVAPPAHATELESHRPQLTYAAVSRNAAPAAAPVAGRSPWLVPAVAAVLVAVATAGYFLWPREAAPLPLVPPPVIAEKPLPPPVEPKVDAPVAVEPKVDAPTPVEPKVDAPVAVEPKVDTPAPVEPKVQAPTAQKVAIVHVTSTPQMEVIADGKSWGITPIDVDLAAGTHPFVLRSLDLGKKRTSTLTLAPGEKKEWGWVLKMGKLLVHVEPFGTVAIDGKVVRSGTSIADVDVYEGKHTVTVSNDELKKKLVRSVEVKPGETAEVSVNLVSDEK